MQNVKSRPQSEELPMSVTISITLDETELEGLVKIGYIEPKVFQKDIGKVDKEAIAKAIHNTIDDILDFANTQEQE